MDPFKYSAHRGSEAERCLALAKSSYCEAREAIAELIALHAEKNTAGPRTALLIDAAMFDLKKRILDAATDAGQQAERAIHAEGFIGEDKT